MLAQSLGLGTCYAGFLPVAARKSGKIDKFLGLSRDRTAHAALLVGYPRFQLKKVPARKPRDTRWL